MLFKLVVERHVEQIRYFNMCTINFYAVNVNLLVSVSDHWTHEDNFFNWMTGHRIDLLLGDW